MPATSFGRLVAATVIALSCLPIRARACGCFHEPPPDPMMPHVPVLQAGERILFAVEKGQVVAHVQIQFQGDAQEFGWLLPTPSVPTLEVGTDELFTMLVDQTAPTYRYREQNLCQPFPGPPVPNCDNFGGDDMAAADDQGFDDDLGGPGGPNPLVVQGAVGPYDYAVLKADDATAMIAWLGKSGYVVSPGMDKAVAPYTHPGAFFLALRLKSGLSAGAIQPVVVRYAGDMPMIPIVLTRLTALPSMPIEVWLLGGARGVPTNFFHVVLDDAAIEWPSVAGPANHDDLVERALRGVTDRHGFVTNFAGASKLVQGQLDPPGRFGDLARLRGIQDAGAYCDYLVQNNYPFNALLVSILQARIAEPPSLVQQGVDPATYYYNLSLYQQQFPQAFFGVDLSYDAGKLTDEIEARVVKPTLATGALLSSFPYLTYLEGRQSPREMTLDPEFGFNPGLPDVPRDHVATLTYRCNPATGNTFDARLETPDGHDVYWPGAQQPNLAMPPLLRIEKLAIGGPPKVIGDNGPTVQKLLQGYDDGQADAAVLPPPADLMWPIQDLLCPGPPGDDGGFEGMPDDGNDPLDLGFSPHGDDFGRRTADAQGNGLDGSAASGCGCALGAKAQQGEPLVGPLIGIAFLALARRRARRRHPDATVVPARGV